MTRHGSGLVCMPVVAQRLDELGIAPMVERNTSRLGTAFSVSIDAKDSTTTGASAHDRAATIRKVLDPSAKASDFSMPGHTFPLRAAEGGVLTRAGQTEAAVDLATLAGLYPAGVITELMKSDGAMARMPELERFAAEHELKLITVKQIIAYRRRNEKLIARRVEGRRHVFTLAPSRMRQAQRWLERHLAFWEGSLDQLEGLLEELKKAQSEGDRNE